MVLLVLWYYVVYRENVFFKYFVNEIVVYNKMYICFIFSWMLIGFVI